MGKARVEVCGRLALVCGGCVEIILFLGRERDWYEPAADGRPRSFMCSGCGGQLTLANCVVEAPRVVLTNRQIASELSISEHTAATYVRRILKKLGLKSRAQIGSWLSERHLSPLNTD